MKPWNILADITSTEWNVDAGLDELMDTYKDFHSQVQAMCR